MPGSPRIMAFALKILDEGGRMRYDSFLTQWKECTHMCEDPVRLAKLAANSGLQNLIVQGMTDCRSAKLPAPLLTFDAAEEIWITPRSKSWLVSYKPEA